MNKETKRVFLILTIGVIAGMFANMTLLAQQQDGVSTDAKLTVKQRQHRKLYKGYGIGKKLRDVAVETPGNDVSVIRGIPQKVFYPDAPRLSLANFLEDLSCSADAIVIAVVKNQTSQLTEDEDFVFSDYDLKTTEILKDNPNAPLRSAIDLSVTRPGGIVELNNKKVQAVDESLGPLKVGGSYLLFLQYIPATESYKAFNSKGSFELSEGRILKLTKESLPSELEREKDAETLLSEIRGATAFRCQQ